MSSTESQKIAKWLSIALFGPAVIVGAYMLYNEISSQNEDQAEAKSITELSEQIKQSFDEVPVEARPILLTVDEGGVTSIEPRPEQSSNVISVITLNHNQCESFAKDLTSGKFNYSTVIVGDKRYQVGEWTNSSPITSCLLAFQQSPESVTVQIEIR